jgi:sarcosine oxidase / L-pipecolate oxidase
MSKDIPSSILIVGSGVFGLSTAYSLTQRPEFKNSKITLLDRLDFPAKDAASIDTSRIVRPDYPDAAYAKLAVQAQKHWRAGFGGEGCYTESGLCFLVDETGDDLQMDYMNGALENLQKKLGLKTGPSSEGGQVTVLDDEKAVREVVNMEGNPGKFGYVNWTSGWAHAENGMKYQRKLVQETGRVEFRKAEIKYLLFNSDDSVSGVKLTTNETITADLTILATGAWTPKFLDLRGIASASGQTLAYIDLTQEEQDRLGANPTVLNETTGLYIIQPRNCVLKIARHGYGYANPCRIPHPERPESGETIEVSLPRTKQDDPELNIPPEAKHACRDFLAKCIPELKDRPFTYTRICWYCDTPLSDWLIDYHPKYKGLFVATGGSGHGYKFLPVIGDRITDVLLEQDRDELSQELKQKWRWPTEKFKTDHVWTDDWRGGRKGMILDEEYARC